MRNPNPPIVSTEKEKPAKGRRPSGRPGVKAGWRTIGGQTCYFRSGWESNYARFLQLLVEGGLISKWEHEPETFWFLQIKRGTRSYLPDFRVTLLDGSVEYHEVKGWMDPKSATKLRRMKLYYPQVKMVLIERKQYEATKAIGLAKIPDWET